ncbi:hypothetical protein J7J56_05015 [candidate division WOR-3 bacterium]|nr:hypothetical protein [candidate division WOR-3 bacterium]
MVVYRDKWEDRSTSQLEMEERKDIAMVSNTDNPSDRGRTTNTNRDQTTNQVVTTVASN